MPDYSISQTGNHKVTLKTKAGWDKKISDIQNEGHASAMRMKQQGDQFLVRILAPNEMQGEDSVPVSGVTIKLDWRVAKKLEMVEASSELITNAYILGYLDPAFPTVLRSIIDGEGLYEYRIGEFFQLYGRFEEKYQLKKEWQTKAKMESLINGDPRFLKPYVNRDRWSDHPLPFAVRNTIAHFGNNPRNVLDPKGNDLRTSIELLRSWVN